MANSLSDYGAGAALTGLFNGTLYVALHTADPGSTGANNEVGSGVGYARQAATFSGSGRSRANAANVVFGPATGAGFGTVTHFSVWDAGSGGNCIAKEALGASVAVPAGKPATFVAGTLTIAA